MEITINEYIAEHVEGFEQSLFVGFNNDLWSADDDHDTD